MTSDIFNAIAEVTSHDSFDLVVQEADDALRIRGHLPAGRKLALQLWPHRVSSLSSLDADFTIESDATLSLQIQYRGTAGKSFSCKTAQHHIGAQGQSTVTVNAVGEDTTHFDYVGTIEVPEKVENITATQRFRGLLLSSSATITATPIMRVASRDTNCEHGTSIGPIDPDILEYCSLCGISKKSAQDVYVSGFLGECQRIEST
ncbi:MAG: SufD family Fe-S cluster assembly protein [Verrucomicrobiota bacterium]|nr:MAG: SufD family Fe-S cluster assembly protein [Verrucomicrobiota bacterium]